MKKLSFLALAAFGLLACQSGRDGKSAATPAPASGDMRVDPNHVVLSWNGGKMTYGELYKKHEGEFRAMKSRHDSEVFQTEQQNLEAFIVQTLVEAEAKKAGKSPEEW